MIWSLITTAMLFDAKSYKIPNQLIALGYLAGLFMDLEEYHLAGSIIFFINALWPILLLYMLFIVGGLGAGDIKLFSVMSALVGANITGRVMIISVFIAGVAAIAICIKERKIVKRRLHYSFYITAGFLACHIL